MLKATFQLVRLFKFGTHKLSHNMSLPEVCQSSMGPRHHLSVNLFLHKNIYDYIGMQKNMA